MVYELYYSDELVTLYRGDCREVSAWWEDGDVLVTDPPYGCRYISNSAKAGPSRPIEADQDTFLRDYALEKWGVARPALVFGTWRVPRPNGVIQLQVWDKGDSPGMGDLRMPWGPAHEEVYVFGSGWHGKREPNVIRVPMLSPTDKERPAHPTPKPLGLMVRLLRKCPAGVVSDPFAGSGTTLVAAKQLGLRAIGVETTRDYCEIAARRLAQGVFPLAIKDTEDEVTIL
jgi:site-specific DNA-methyltransferase (adenine-specific)